MCLCKQSRKAIQKAIMFKRNTTCMYVPKSNKLKQNFVF